MDILTPNFIKYQLYLLQLENYELLRYWKLLFGKGFFPSQRRPLRKELVWTVKAKALLLMAVAMHVLAVIGAGLITIALQRSVDGLLGVLLLVFLLGLPFYFLWLSLALLLIWPLDNYVKKRLVGQARLKLVKL
ncbi:MAG: hypothetical protein KGJ93_05555, partial [Patescibacteria group bacterium]|nr:hypothetical protein [Patescibacteria group bacterium]